MALVWRCPFGGVVEIAQCLHHFDNMVESQYWDNMVESQYWDNMVEFSVSLQHLWGDGR